MAEFVLKNARIIVGGADISGDMNEVTVNRSAEVVDNTVFGSSGKRRLAGLKDFQVTGGGFFNAASTVKIDPHMFSELGTTAHAVTVAQNSSLGSICYSANEVLSQYVPAGRIGEMMKFNFACYGDGDAYRGNLMEAGTGLSSALSATPRNLGVCSSSQYLHGVVHVKALSSSGGTHTIRPYVQIGTSSGFSSSTLSTALKMSAIDWSTRRVSGEIKSTSPGTTDEWYRFRIDSSGSTNSKMSGLLALAIQ